MGVPMVLWMVDAMWCWLLLSLIVCFILVNYEKVAEGVVVANSYLERCICQYISNTTDSNVIYRTYRPLYRDHLYQISLNFKQ